MKRTALLLLIFSILHPPGLQPQTRLQIGLERDSNIRETPAAALSAPSLRLLAQTQKSGRNTWRSISFQNVSALQLYWDHPEENKLVTELRIGDSGSLGSVQARIDAWGRLKLWLNDVFDYGTGGLRLRVSLPLLRQVQATASAHYAALDYANLNGFDSGDLGLDAGLLLRRRSHRFGVTLRWQRIRFDRNAVAADFSEEPVYRFLSSRQIDRLATVELFASRSGRLLGRLSYELQRNDSNSFGFSYWRHRIQLLLGTRIGGEVMLRLLAAGQIKSYLERLPEDIPALPRDLDTEREQSNFVVADLSRPLTADMNAVLRLAWYSNETPLRSRFYRKSLVTLALETRF